MLTLEEKQHYSKVLKVNGYGLSNIIRNLAKKKNKDLYSIDKYNIDEYINSQNAENAFWDKVYKICEENNYKGNYKYILSTVGHMKNQRCHTKDKIQNVKNYFEIMNYQNYLRINKLSELVCKCCGNRFLSTQGKYYCSLCYVKANCYECGKELNRLRIKNDNSKYYCDVCKGKKSAKNNKESGICSICGNFNYKRDQNARGKDNQTTINKKTFIDKKSRKIILKGMKIGCDCSLSFYNQHNSSDAMIEQARKLGKEYGKINITKYNKSKEHRKIARITGLKYGIKNLKIYKNFIHENFECSKHGLINIQFYDKRVKKYICWYCYKEEALLNDNLYIPNNCKCKNCKKLIDTYSNFCDKICEINYENDKNLQFKHNNNCILHPDEELTFKNEC